MTGRKIKVLIVEHDRAAGARLAEVLGADPHVEVIGTAEHGASALKVLAHRTPDVVTVNVHLLHMNAFELTRRIMESHPVPVVVVSPGFRREEAATAFAALEAGAVAVATAPEQPGTARFEADAAKLLQTIRAMSEVRVVRRWTRKSPKESSADIFEGSEVRPAQAEEISIVAIGASTGGPPVLQFILSRLPRSFPVPVLIVQHIAPGFVRGLAGWLDQSTGFPVHMARPGEPARPGHAYLAPDGQHLGIESNRRMVLTADLPNNGSCPSIAHMFSSVARSFGSQAAAVLLTGMGRDGARELAGLKTLGALTVAQDRESCVVFGMPREAAALDAACYVLSPEGITALLLDRCRSRFPAHSAAAQI